jgi:hypothetical protein
MHRRISSFGILFATLAFSILGITAAHAPGSITLDEVMQQLKDNQKLIAAITAELKAQSLKAENVICVGARFGGHWANLGGARAVPYECDIGKRKLKIEGQIHLYDSAGKEIDMDAPAAPEQAADYKQTDLKWTWQ